MYRVLIILDQDACSCLFATCCRSALMASGEGAAASGAAASDSASSRHAAADSAGSSGHAAESKKEPKLKLKRIDMSDLHAKAGTISLLYAMVLYISRSGMKINSS